MGRTIKVALIGSSGTGKTSLRGQFTSGQFSTSYRATIGADFIAKTIRLSDRQPLFTSNGDTSNVASTSAAAAGPSHQPVPETGEPVTLQIWDTAGQERFSALSSAFFRGADAAIIVYDVRRPKSLAEVTTWWRAFADKCPVPLDEEATWPVVVVGNKIDLLDKVEGAEDAVWRREEAREFVEKLIDVGEEEEGAHPQTEGTSASSSRRTSEEGPKAVRITINGHNVGIDGLSNGNPPENRLYPAASTTYTSSRTGNTIFHTPSSSFNSSEESEHFHSAASSFYSPSSASEGPISPSQSVAPSLSRRSRRRMTIDTLSSSSETITPSLYARGAGAQLGSPTPRTPSIRHPWPHIPLDLDPPERGAKLLFTSAKTGEGVSEVFDYIARRTVKRLEWFEAYHRDYAHEPDGPFGESSVVGFGRALGTERSSLTQFGTLAGKCC